MITNYSYGIVEGDNNRLSLLAKNEKGNTIIRLEVNDLEGLKEVVSEEELWNLFEEFRQRMDRIDEESKLPQIMYDLNVSDECWNDILNKVVKKLNK